MYTKIARGDGMKYTLKYNAFHNLESIGIDGKAESLIKYTYKNGNGRLKEIAYANGDRMNAVYNTAGQLIAEKWFNKDNALIAHYKYVYDSSGNIVRSIDIICEKEYNLNTMLRATRRSISIILSSGKRAVSLSPLTVTPIPTTLTVLEQARL